MKQFICKDGASNYYLVNDGRGGFLNPPTHPEHSYSICEYRGRHECGSMSLTCARDTEYLPAKVRIIAKWILKRWQAGEPDSAWLDSVYNYFRHCYSVDGVNRDTSHCVIYGKFWGNAEQEQDENPEHSLAYLYVKEFYPDHKPDMERLAGNCKGGQWSRSTEG